MTSKIIKTDIPYIHDELQKIKNRVEQIRETTPFPYRIDDSNYLDTLRKRILENHKYNIQVLSISQESFQCSVTSPGWSLETGIIFEDGYYYEDALLFGIEHCLNLIEKNEELTSEIEIAKQNNHITTEVYRVLNEKLILNETEISPDKNLFKDLGAEELDIVEIITELEKVFGIEIAEEDIVGFRTVEDIINYISQTE